MIGEKKCHFGRRGGGGFVPVLSVYNKAPHQKKSVAENSKKNEQNIIPTRSQNPTHLEAGGPVEQLYHVADGGLAGLGEVWLQPLHHKHHQHLPAHNETDVIG